MSSKTSYELPTFGDYTEVRKKEQGTQTAPPAPEYLEKAKTWIVPSSDFFQGVRVLVNYCNCVASDHGGALVSSRANSTLLNIRSSHTCIVILA